MTLEELTQIVRDWIPPGYYYEIEAYTMEPEESRAYYRKKQKPSEAKGFHLDICPVWGKSEIIETVFVPVETEARTVRWLVSVAIQTIQKRQQTESVTPYLEREGSG